MAVSCSGREPRRAALKLGSEQKWSVSKEELRLDPTRFPQRLDIELPERVLTQLEALSRRSGLSVEELASNLLSQLVKEDQV